VGERGFVRVTNTTRGAVLAARAELADDAWARLVGLLGRAGLPSGGGMVLEPCDSVHTAFMRFPIDVLVLSPEGEVLVAEGDVRPWRLVWPVRGGRAVVELPGGTIALTGTVRGDRVVREGLEDACAST
jgi:uncharacterized membrane protein (UPF0127 family)